MQILRIVKYYLGRLYYSKIIEKYDLNAALNTNYKKNFLNKNGYKKYTSLNKKDISILKAYFLKKKKNLINDNNVSKVFNKIFKKIFPDIVKYIGINFRLEYLQIQKTSKKDENSVSVSWHSDAVGIRLKCYICLDGDGTQPTLILKNSNNKIYKPNILEDFRFLGVKRLETKKNQVFLKHKTGSIYLFDTNYLHRGGYNFTNSSRTVIVMEFADYKKSNELIRDSFVSVPIGKQNSKIKFGKIFLKNFKYRNFLRNYLII